MNVRLEFEFKENVSANTTAYDKNQDSLRSSIVSKSRLHTTFVDLQGLIVGKKFVVKEVAVLRKGAILSHYIFTCSMP